MVVSISTHNVSEVDVRRDIVYKCNTTKLGQAVEALAAHFLGSGRQYILTVRAYQGVEEAVFTNGVASGKFSHRERR